MIYLLNLAGSTPAFLSCAEVDVKRESHVGSLLAWVCAERPMRVRKVGTSGTVGVGRGAGGGRREACRVRVVVWLVGGFEMGRRREGSRGSRRRNILLVLLGVLCGG